MLETVFGLPLHPLVVHAAVVLVPLAAIGAVLMAVSSRFSRRFGVLVTVIAALGLIASVLAKSSGEELAEQVGMPQPHAELADPMPIIALVLAALVPALWLLDRGRPTNRRRPVPVVIVAVAGVLVAVLATVWMVRVGHTGAEAVWSRVGAASAGVLVE